MSAENFPNFNAAVAELTLEVETLLTSVSALQSVANIQSAINSANDAQAQAVLSLQHKDAAALSEVNAEAFKDQAGASAVSAAQSATEADLSAQASSADRILTQAAATSAEQAATDANSHRVAAASSETGAAQHLAAGLVAKDLSEAAAVAAGISADEADASKVIADTKATEAAASAAAALISEQNTGASEAAAALSEQNAEASAVGVSTYAANALASQNAAADSEQLAAGHATDAEAAELSAVTAAGTATTKATEAGGHATDAAASATSSQTFAGQAEASADSADASAALSLAYRDAALTARDEAVQAAAAITGGMSEFGGIDLSGGAYPTPPTNAGFWKVTTGGTVGGIDYGVGDTLVYSKNLEQFYKIDNTESVTSVNGMQGAVTIGFADVGALGANQNAVSATKLATARTINGQPFDGTANITIVDATKEPAVPASSADNYMRGDKSWANLATAVKAVTLGGFAVGVNAAVTAADTLLVALGKIQAQIAAASGLSQGTNSQDPNSAVHQVIMTNHANSPASGVYWHITTTFYSSISSTGNRSQLAVQYNNGSQVYARSCFSGVWTSWVKLDHQGTVTSVGMSVPTGFSVGGSPVTDAGTLAMSFAAGYSLPTTAKQALWDTAHGWGNHASAGYATQAWVNGQGFLTEETDPKRVSTLAFTGTTTKTLTLTLADGTTVTGNFSDANTVYAIPALTELQAGTVTTARTISAERLKQWGDWRLSGYATESYVTSQGFITGSGNAATASTLQTARNINGQPFDGSTNITVADSTKLPLAGGTMTGAITATGSTAVALNPGGTARGKLFADASGVGFATTADAWALKVLSGTVNLEAAGSFSAAGAITETSDANLKQNVERIEGALGKLCKLSGYTYEMIAAPEQRRTGVIAQEVAEALPEAVNMGPDGHMTVAYGNMVGLVIEAVKELAEQNTDLRTEIEQLRKLAGA